MEAEEDEMIVVVIGNDAEEPGAVAGSLSVKSLDKTEFDEVNDLLEKHGELIDINTIKTEYEEDFVAETDCFEDDTYIKNEFELNEESCEVGDCKQDNLLREVETLKIEYEDIDFLEESENFDDITIEDEDIKFQQIKYRENDDFVPYRKKLLQGSEVKSYIKKLQGENPELQNDTEALILRLAEIMKDIKPPEPPKDFFRVMDCDLLFECVRCYASCNVSRVFSSQMAVQRHYQEKHGPRYLNCFACGVDFRSKTNLYKHEKRCSAPDSVYVLRARALMVGAKGRSRPYLSNNSNKKAKDKRSPQKFSCSYCPAMFITKGGLVAHENLHRGERPYRCDVCGAAYTSSPALMRHRKTHLGLKYICDHCGREFKIKHVLVAHMDTHLSVKKYACHYEGCDRRFSQKTHLNIHIDSRHKNLPPPFACQACPRRYPRMSMLKVHMKKAHGMILMTRRMFLKTLPKLSDAQMQQAKNYLLSKKDFVGRRKENEVRNCGPSLDERDEPANIQEIPGEGTLLREDTEELIELPEHGTAGEPIERSQILREDTGRFQGLDSETGENTEGKRKMAEGSNRKKELDVIKYLDKILQRKCRQLATNNTRKAVETVYVESGEVVDVTHNSGLRRSYEKLCSDVQAELHGESMPEL